MKTKLCISVFVLLILRLTGFSQTYIGPIIGYSLSEIVETQEALHGDCPTADWLHNKEGYLRNSIMYGFRVEKAIFARLNISFQADYRRQKLVDDNCRSFDLKYNILSSSLLLNANVYRSFNIGIGATYSYHHNFNFGDSYIKHENFLGYALSGSYKFKNIMINLSYKALKNIDKDNQYYYRMILSSRSFELSASYMFELFKK